MNKYKRMATLEQDIVSVFRQGLVIGALFGGCAMAFFLVVVATV